MTQDASPPALQRRHWLTLALATLAAPLAQAATDKPLRLVLPNATGSGVDTITRVLQPALAKVLGTAVIVENQPGAGGIVGLQTLARATPDGSLLSIVSNNAVILPAAYKKLPFDMPGDFTPIAICGYTPMVVVVNSKVPANNATELTALLRAKPNELNFGSGGDGTILHLAAEMYLDEINAKALHVPYKGVGPMVAALLSGQVEFGVVSLPSVQGQLKSGALRAVGVMTAKRVPSAADIPTLAEQGMPNFSLDAWFGLLGPKGMSADDVQHYQQAVTTAFADPAVKEAMQKQGNVINVSSSDYAAQFFRSEMVRYARLVKKAGIEPQ